MMGPRSRINRQRWITGAALCALSFSGTGLVAAQSVPEAAVTSIDSSPTGPDLGSDSAPRSRAGHPPELPASARAAPLVRQERSYSCGAAALLSVLRYFRAWDGPEQSLYAPLATSPEDGTLPEMLAEVAGSLGLAAKVEQPMTIPTLREHLRAGRLVILELQAWPEPGTAPLPWASRWDDGHFVVLIALDDLYAYFMDPSTSDGYTYLELDELGPRWHDVNPTRDSPLLAHDYQLGVVIGRPASFQPTVVAAGPPAKLRPLRKLE